ncbi:MAG: hypothetical protein ACYC8V_08360 [Caulobacteraceae bacterium]
MGRRGPRPGVLIAALGAGLAAAGLAAASLPGAPPLRAMRWLVPGADAARLLTRRKPECLNAPAEGETAYEVELGRAAFRSPLTLGGQAARAGVACETCHQNGRTNPDFDFPGLSGAPGTADVTSFLFSSHRGDHIDDPRPIPDLGGPKAALKVSQVQASGELEHFIDGLITEEFEGPEPPLAVLQGLAAYVRALGPEACPAVAIEPLRARSAIEDSRRAVRAALAALAHGDPASAGVMVEAARAQLGLLAERYPASATPRARAALRIADLDLAADLDDLRVGRIVADRLTAWLGRSEEWAAILTAEEDRSLYDPAVLARVSAAQGDGPVKASSNHQLPD